MTDIQMIPIDLIDPHPHNPRRDLGFLDELADSIREQGIRQNLLVVPYCPDCLTAGTEHGVRVDEELGDWMCPLHQAEARFRAVIGHRRLGAAKLAGLDAVPAVVDAALSEAAQLELMLVENIQRSDLSPVEEADGYQGLLDLGVKVREIATRTGRAEKTVTSRLRLAKLPDDAREKVHTRQATLDDAAQLDAFVGHPKLLAKVVAALGTHNWRWVLEDARRELRIGEAKKLIKAELKKLGVPHHTTDGYAWAEWRMLSRLDTVKAAQALKVEDLPDGTVWVDTYSAIEVIRPLTEDEKSEASRRRDTDGEAERELTAQLIAQAELAAGLRDAFLRDLVARKSLTAAETDLILEHAVLRVVMGYTNLGWLMEHFTGVSHQQTHALVAAVQEKFPTTPPAVWLLVATCLRDIPDDWYGWRDIAERPSALAAYELLVKLGYELSDVEHARLYPEPETGVCRECGCTDEDACTDPEPCHWVEPDLCSACAAIDPSYVPEGL